jgi:PhnB protein
MAVFLDVYLFFRGNCREAMEFYKSVFGGELTVSTYGESPGADQTHKDSLMHARLEGGGVKIMGSDVFEKQIGKGQIELSIGGSDEDEMRKLFDKLSEGGKVRQPLEKQFWGDVFGSLTDKYDVDWMMNITMPGSQTDK